MKSSVTRDAPLPAVMPLRLNQQEGLRQIIFEQAGTLSKALMEAVMNSVDQGASTIRVTIDSRSVRVEDDGKGFQSWAEIDAVFAEFAAPHVRGDAAFGRYRVGRGQLFAKGVNRYCSNSFAITCDARKKLELVPAKCYPPYRGCSVHITLYDEEPAPERLAVELADACRYVDARLVINESIVVGRNMVRDAWDDQVYNGFRARLRGDAKTLKVYNQGVIVAEHGSSWLACRGMAGGVVTSEPGHAFELNTARNEAQDSCPLWGLVKKLSKEVLAAYRREKQFTVEAEAGAVAAVYKAIGSVVGSAKPGLAETQITQAIHQHLRSSGNHDKIRDIAWVPSTSGDVRSPKYIQRYGMLTSGVAGNPSADKLMQRKEAFAVNIALLLQECDLAEAYADVVMRVLSALTYLRVTELSALSTRSTYRLLTKAEVNATAITRVWHSVLSGLMWNEGCNVSVTHNSGSEAGAWRFSGSREFMFGECDSANVMGWTDGSTYIAIPTALLPKTTTPSLRVQLRALDLFANILRHEWCHTDKSDMPNHIHSPAFYELFHNASTLPSVHRHDSVAMAQLRLARGFERDKALRERAAAKRAFLDAQRVGKNKPKK